MRLYLVRHGETQSNRDKIIQGHMNIPLTDTGIEQAYKVAHRLGDHDFDVIYTSDLSRTKETADAIIKHHLNTPYILDERLRERNWGPFQGMRGEEKDRFALEHGIASHDEFAPYGVEIDTQFLARIADFLTDIQNKHADQTVLCVTHGGWIKLFTTQLYKLRPSIEKYSLRNTGISIYDYIDGQRSEILYNDASHLENDGVEYSE